MLVEKKKDQARSKVAKALSDQMHLPIGLEPSGL